MKTEKELEVSNGYVLLTVLGVILCLMLIGLVATKNPLCLILLPIIIFLAKGFFIVNPNSSKSYGAVWCL